LTGAAGELMIGRRLGALAGCAVANAGCSAPAARPNESLQQPARRHACGEGPSRRRARRLLNSVVRPQASFQMEGVR